MKPAGYVCGFAAFALLAGCMSPESCDPNKVSNVFSSALCSSGGQFDSRQAAMSSQLINVQDQILRERQEISVAQGKIRALDSQMALTRTQKTEVARRMSILQGDVSRLENTPAGSAESMKLQEKIKRQKSEIDNYLNISVF